MDGLGTALEAVKGLSPAATLIVMGAWFWWQATTARRLGGGPEDVGKRVTDMHLALLSELKAIRGNLDRFADTQRDHGTMLSRVEKIEDKLDRWSAMPGTNPEIRRP
jgi:hypothetical protein